MEFPTSVYRLQLNPYFPFKKAKKYLPYFKRLGIDALYLSPFFQPTPGSMHGYDVCSPHEINHELGTWDDFYAFAKEAKDLGLKLIADVVANHMSATTFNPWWNDVLESGQGSKYEGYFDIDWEPARKDLKGKVLLPYLATTLKEALKGREIHVGYHEGILFVRYDKYSLPLCLKTYEMVLKSDDPIEDVREFNDSYAQMRQLLEKQHFLLTIWQEGPASINYRRFFDINELAALKMERDEVFEDYHRTLFKLVDEGVISGLRIDHPDGFYDPKRYFESLQKRGEIYVVVEKILEYEEELPSDWLVHGTVGYEFLNDLNGLFIKEENASAFDKIYEKFIGEKIDPDRLLFENKRDFALIYMRSELNSLARLGGIDEELLADFVASFPVYRSYVAEEFRSDDREVMETALKAVGSEKLRKLVFENRDFVMKLQQLTPPIMAKGLEDTFCYVYNRFVSLNEVGGSPLRFGRDVRRFHEKNKKRLPGSFITTSTHDTKRSEDVRMRLNVLSEIPERWKKKVNEWRDINDKFKRWGPDANLEYFFYQNLIGVWGDRYGFFERMKNFMYKAMREAKVHTNWVNHDDNYETAVIKFVQDVLNEEKNPDFFKSFLPFAEEVSERGKVKALGALCLKICSPGVVDVYQGIEDWNYALVDPDNRRPVDFENLSKIEGGHTKFALYQKGLRLRQEHPSLFLKGEYRPVETDSSFVAFMRREGDIEVLAFARRFESKASFETDKKWHPLVATKDFGILLNKSFA